jgi:hypothetical protein
VGIRNGWLRLFVVWGLGLRLLLIWGAFVAGFDLKIGYSLFKKQTDSYLVDLVVFEP